MYIREDFDKIISEGFNNKVLTEENKQEVSFEKIRKAVEKGIKARITHGVKLVKYDELEADEQRTVELVFPHKKYNEIRHRESVIGYDVYYYVRTINNKAEKITSVIAFKHSEKFPYVGIPFKKYLGKTKYENNLKEDINMNIFNEMNQIIEDEGLNAEVFNEGLGDKIKEIRGNGKIKKLTLKPVANTIATFIVKKEETDLFKLNKRGMMPMVDYRAGIVVLHNTLLACEFFEAAMKNKNVAQYVNSLKSYNATVHTSSVDYNVNILSYLKGSLKAATVKTLLNSMIKDAERYIKNDAKPEKKEKYTSQLNELKKSSKDVFPSAYASYKKKLELIKEL